MPSVSTELSRRATIEEMVLTYDQAVADLRAGYALIDSAMMRLGSTFEQDGEKMRVRSRRWHNMTFEDPEPAITEIRREVWRSILERLKLRQAMSVRAWVSMEKKLNDAEPPPLTVEMIETIVKQLHSELPNMIQESIAEVFDWLRPRCSKYKTNTEFALRNKVVLSRIVVHDWQHWGVNYWSEQHLLALENVFAICDGKPGAPPDGYYSDLSSAIKAIPHSAPCVGSTPYFHFKGFRNQNLHLEFLRPDLVAKLNAIAGGARLVPVGQDSD